MRAHGSDRLASGNAVLVAGLIRFQLPARKRLKLELPQRRDGIGALPVADVALKDAQRFSDCDLSPEVPDEIVVGHGLNYGATHMGFRINLPYRAATVGGMKTIGDRIRDARKSLGLNQTQLAKAVGVDQSTVSDMERGASFGADVLMALSAALMKSPQWIMTGRADAIELSEVEANMIRAYRASTGGGALPTTKPAEVVSIPKKRDDGESRSISSPWSPTNHPNRRATDKQGTK